MISNLIQNQEFFAVTLLLIGSFQKTSVYLPHRVNWKLPPPPYPLSDSGVNFQFPPWKLEVNPPIENNFSPPPPDGRNFLLGVRVWSEGQVLRTQKFWRMYAQRYYFLRNSIALVII